MTTTSDARKRLAEAAQEVGGGDVVSDAAVEAAARRTWRDEHGSISSPDGSRTPESDEAERDRTGYGEWDSDRVSEHVKAGYRRRARNALTAALPHLRRVWEVERAASNDPWCRREDCRHRHWRSGNMPTHRRGEDCPA